MVPEVGQRVGPYEILGRLGSGGMGLVFSAWDARLQRDVAIKLLRDEYTTPEMRSRFLQEARAASSLNHANICTIFDIGEQEGDPYMVMELLKGEPLRQRMNAAELEPREICRVAQDVADALSLAHSRSIIHRDIKPANIFLVDRPGGFNTKVLDFGLAKIETYGADSLFDLTHTGTTVGTVSYMSPEQARGEGLDPRSDLFSLGVVLYEMATGRLPFQGATSALVFVELLGKPPDAIRPQNPAISPDLERLILKLLQKDRTLRFQNGQQVVEAALQALAGGPASDPRRVALAEARPAGTPQPPSSGNGGGPLSQRRSTVQVSQPNRHDVSAAHRALSQMPEPERKSPSRESVPGTVPADALIRPRPRVTLSESSAVLRAARESSPAQPLAKPPSGSTTPAPPSLGRSSGSHPTTRIVPDHAEPAYDPPEGPPAPSRPIIRPSERAVQLPAPNISLPRVTAPRPAPRFTRYEEIDEEGQVVRTVGPSAADTETAPKPRVWLLLVGLLAMGLIGLVAWKLWPRSAPAGPGKVIPIVLAPVNVAGGDNLLGGAVSMGLAFDLSQSPQFLVMETAALNAGLRSQGLAPDASRSADDIRRAARAIGVTEILNADLRSSGGAYTVSVRVVSTDTGSEVYHTEQTAQSREQIPDALDRVLRDMRNGLGEDNATIARTTVPLSKEATGSIEALYDYSTGLELMGQGKLVEAAAAFEQATAADSHFTQAHLRLADLYRTEHAPVSAQSAAVSGQASAQLASQRTQQLAAATYALNATGDLAAAQTASQTLLQAYPNSVRARIDLAQALREQGKFAESAAAAEAALHRQPFNSAATALAEMNLIAGERATAARNVENTSRQAGHTHPELNLLITYLMNGAQGPIDTTANASEQVGLAEMQAALLDATGSMHAGQRMWQEVATQAAARATFVSAAADALATAAINRALSADCAAAASLWEEAQNFPMGSDARARVGLAAGLCGDLGTARSSLDALTRSFPQSFRVRLIYGPEINALIQWRSGQADDALATLQNVRQYDNISLSPLLRGLIHVRTGHPQDAISDFQYVVQHPGSASLVNPTSIPMAQLGLARAYSASGDRLNSGMAYSRFLTLWNGADPGNPLLGEARANAAR